ncbi:MAG: hypothetical protein JSV52_04855 [Candidatus Zixiibacteriota bacterium]|nr:MAG: hypothetical protein JSV52_04855 [candidate division Zixibacteria bacterium]
MTEATQKKGLSKGCLIGLIVAGVVLVMIIIAAIVVWVYKDDIARFGANTLVTSIQNEVAENPIMGIDSTHFANVCSAFAEKLKTEPVDGLKYQAFIQKVQAIVVDKRVDSLEAVMFMDAVFDYFPELEELYPTEEVPDTTIETDSVEAGIQ